MRPGPATRAAFVIVDVLKAVFRLDERSPRKRTRKRANIDNRLKLALQDPDSALPSLLEEGLPRRPQSPGTGTLDKGRISPGDSLSRKSPATPNPNGNGSRTSHAFDCKHFAATEERTQRQSGARLCKNCGAVKLPVEGKGKASINSRGGGLPYNRRDDSASSRNVAGEASEPGDCGNAWGRL
jgi:hypothetical protein